MKRHRIGIIGCGAAARRYYLPVFKKYPELIPDLHLVDLNRQTAENLATELGGGEIFKDYQDIIGKVDGVIIAIPHFFHFPIARDFLQARVHVLCEKPLAETLSEVKFLNEVAERNNVQLCVNNTRRMFPNFKKAKEIIASGIIGAIKSIHYIEGNTFGWPSETGFYVNPKVSSKGVLLDIGSHAVDTICWWLGKKPLLVQYQDDSFGGPESLACLIAQNNGSRIELILNRLIDLENVFRITGEAGIIEGKIFEWSKMTLYSDSQRKIVIKIKHREKVYPDFVKPIIENFLQVIQGKSKALISGKDVEASVALIEEAYANRQRIKMMWYENLEKIFENA